jgi:hypothetical protein
LIYGFHHLAALNIHIEVLGLNYEKINGHWLKKSSETVYKQALVAKDIRRHQT